MCVSEESFLGLGIILILDVDQLSQMSNKSFASV